MEGEDEYGSHGVPECGLDSGIPSKRGGGVMTQLMDTVVALGMAVGPLALLLIRLGGAL